MKINRLWVIMFSKKAVFEQYLGKMGLNKTVLEAVKDINGVLFESLDDLLAEYDEPEISSVPEVLPGEEPVKPEPTPTVSTASPRVLEKNEMEFDPNKEYTSAELEDRLKIPYTEALQRSRAWAHNQETRFGMLWNEWGGIDKISFMRGSRIGEHVFFSADRILYEISAEGEGDVKKFTYQTTPNQVKMSKDVFDRISQYYESKGISVGDLKDFSFDEIRHLVLGNGVHPTGEEAPNIGIPCKVEVTRDATVLAIDADDHDMTTWVITPNPKRRAELIKEYGLPVECVNTVMIKEWCASTDRYRMDVDGVVYDISKKSVARGLTRQDVLPNATMKRRQENSLRLTWKVVEWAKAQDMFRLLLKPDASGVRKMVYTSTIHKVPNDGNIEDINPNTPYVYMDDDNYKAYVENTPNFDQSKVINYDVNALNTIVKDEYSGKSTTDTSGANSYGYDENGWVTLIECEPDGKHSHKWKLKEGVAEQIRKAYASNVAGTEYNNYIAGKNIIKIGGTRGEDGVLRNAYDCHPLVRLERSGKGYKARLVAVFDESCCKPGESLTKIVGVDGMRGGTPTIEGFAEILDGTNLGKTGDFQINECVLSKVDISKSTGFVKLGNYVSGDAPPPVRTIIKNTVISVGDNGADKMLPNNQIIAEVSGRKVRGVEIYDSTIVDSVIENGYAVIVSCHLRNLHMSNSGAKYLKEWAGEYVNGPKPEVIDAGNVVFEGDQSISVRGSAKYGVGFTRSIIPGVYGKKKFEAGDVKTQFSGSVTLNATAGTVICAGSMLNNVVANGPCKIRTSVLNSTTIGFNAETGGDFRMTDVCGVDTKPAGTEGATSIIIAHGIDKPTILGNADKDSEHGSIILSGKVYIEGGAQIYHSAVESPDAEQVVYVRGNMVLDGCSPYTLNKRDSALISERIHSENNFLSGVCTDKDEISRRMQLGSNAMGTSVETNSFEKYRKFRESGNVGACGKELHELTLYNAETLIEDFLVNEPNAVSMSSNVFTDMLEDGTVVPKPEMKTTIWDPTGAFFVAVINKVDGKINYGRVVLLKCPNVRLKHDAIFKKRHMLVYNMDYEMYASGRITLRQYVDYLKENDYLDCFYYVDEEGKPTTKPHDFVQVLLIANKDKKTPRIMSAESLDIVKQNNIRIVTQYRLINTSKPNDVRDADGYSGIESAYAMNDGSMAIETVRSDLRYSAPKANPETGKITCVCEKSWTGDEGKGQSRRYTVDCRTDEMYRAGYAYLLKKSLSSNAAGLERIKNALAGNHVALVQTDGVSAAVNAAMGRGIESTPDTTIGDDKFSSFLKSLGLQPGETVYVLSYTNSENEEMRFLAAGRMPRVTAKERLYLKNTGCEKMEYRKITFDPTKKKIRVVSPRYAETALVKFRNNLKYSPVRVSHMLAREANMEDFVKLLKLPKSMQY